MKLYMAPRALEWREDVAVPLLPGRGLPPGCPSAPRVLTVLVRPAATRAGHAGSCYARDYADDVGIAAAGRDAVQRAASGLRHLRQEVAPTGLQLQQGKCLVVCGGRGARAAVEADEELRMIPAGSVVRDLGAALSGAWRRLGVTQERYSEVMQAARKVGRVLAGGARRQLLVQQLYPMLYYAIGQCGMSESRLGALRALAHHLVVGHAVHRRSADVDLLLTRQRSCHPVVQYIRYICRQLRQALEME